MKDKRILIFVSILLLLTLVSQVSAQDRNFLNDIFEPFKNVDVAETYDRYQPFIDAFIYFLVFISVAKVTLAKRFSGPGGNALVASIGIILAIAMSFWSAEVGFSIKQFGIVAAGLFIGIVFFSIFALIRHQGGNVAAASALGYVLVFLLVLGIMPGFVDQIKNTTGLSTIWGIANIVFVIALVIALMGIVRFFRGEWVSGGSGGSGGGGGGGRSWFRGPAERDARREEREKIKKDKEIAKADQFSRRLSSEIGSVANRIESLQDIEKKLLEADTVHDTQVLKLLGRLEQEIADAVGIGTLLKKVGKEMDRNPIAYNTAREYIFENARKYKDYMSVVHRILLKIKELLENEQRLTSAAEQKDKTIKELKKILAKRTEVEKKIDVKMGGFVKTKAAIAGQQETPAIKQRSEEVERQIQYLKGLINKLKEIEDQNYKNANAFKNLYGEIEKSINRDVTKINRTVQNAIELGYLKMAIGLWEGVKKFLITIGKSGGDRAIFALVPDLIKSARDRLGKLVRMKEALRLKEDLTGNELQIIQKIKDVEDKIEGEAQQELANH